MPNVFAGAHHAQGATTLWWTGTLTLQNLCDPLTKKISDIRHHRKCNSEVSTTCSNAGFHTMSLPLKYVLPRLSLTLMDSLPMCSNKSSKTNQLHWYAAQLSQQLTPSPCCTSCSLSIACLSIFLISLSSLSLSVCPLWCALISVVQRFKDLGHSDLPGSYSRQVWRTNNGPLNKPQNQFRACVLPHIGKLNVRCKE